MFPSTTPTLAADVAEMAQAEGGVRRAARLLRPARLDRARGVDGAGAAGRRDAGRRAGGGRGRAGDSLRAGRPDRRHWRRVASRRSDRSCRAVGHGAFAGFKEMPRPAWDLLPLANYRLPMVSEAYIIVETSRGCPYSCDFCVAPIHQGHKFRERRAEGAGGRDRVGAPRARRPLLLSLGRHGHVEPEDVRRVLRGADRAEPRHPVVRQRARRQPDRSGLRPPTEAIGLLDARDGHRVVVARDPQGHGEAARGAEDPRGLRQPARCRHQVVRVLHLRLSGRHARIDGRDHRLRDRSGSRTSRTSIPAVPYPGTALYEKVQADGLLKNDDWSRMEYSVLRARRARARRARW